MAHQGFIVFPVVRKERNANRTRGRHLGILERERHLHALQYLPGHHRRIVRTAHITQPNHKLVPPVAGHDVGPAQGVVQALCHLLEKVVPGCMAQRIVDDLEVVQVHKQQGHPQMLATRQRNRTLQALAPQTPIGQAGQSIVLGQVGQLRLRLAVTCDLQLEAGQRFLQIVQYQPDGQAADHQNRQHIAQLLVRRADVTGAAPMQHFGGQAQEHKVRNHTAQQQKEGARGHQQTSHDEQGRKRQKRHVLDPFADPSQRTHHGSQ